MRILYFGVFDGKTWRSEYPMLKGLQAQGHEVFPINFRQRWPGTIRRAYQRYGHLSDLIFIQNGNPFPQQWLKRFEQPVVYMASEYALSSAQHILEASPEGVLAHSQQVVDYCIQKNIPVQRVHHAFHEQYYHLETTDYLYDLCFIGSLNPRRQAWLAPLKQALGERMFIGEVWQPERINTLYNQSKLVIHIHAAEESYIPTRFFEVLPTQACFITESLGTNLTPDLCFEGYAQFNTPEEAWTQIQKLLADAELRNKMNTEAQAQAPKHSWQGRMKTYSEYFKETVNRYEHAPDYSL
jgi:hypothetical protein